MNLYSYSFDEKFLFVTIQNSKADISYIRNQLSIGKGSKERRSVNLIPCESSISKNSLADFPGFFSYGLLLRKHVFDLIGKVLCDCGEFIEMTYENEVFYYLNTTTIIDIVDFDKTEFNMFEGYVTGIKKLRFYEELGHTPMIFKMKKLENQPPIVSEEFVNLVRKHKLTGLTFKKIN